MSTSIESRSVECRTRFRFASKSILVIYRLVAAVEVVQTRQERKHNCMENNPLDNLPPEARQRVEAALQALGGGTSPSVFISQSPGANQGNVPQETGWHPEGGPGVFGGGTFPGMNQVFSSLFTNVSKKQAGHDQAWAHWDYDPYEWALFDKVDWVPVRNKSRRTLIMGPVLCLAIIVALLTVVWVASQSIAVALLVVLAPAIILLTVLMLLMISAASSVKEAKKRYLARQNQAEPHRVTFSNEGVWEAGTFFAFKFGRLELESVKRTANPAVLHFKMLKFNYDGSWTGTAQRVHVLVPRGYEAEAEQLRQRYYTEVIKVKTKYNPPEPI